MNKYKTCVTVIFACLMLFCFTNANAQENEKVLKVRNSILGFVNCICGNLPTYTTETNKLKLNLEGSAKLNSLVAKIVDIEGSASGSLIRESATSVLQEDLANTIIETNKCRLEAFKIVTDKLISDKYKTGVLLGLLEMPATPSSILLPINMYKQLSTEEKDLAKAQGIIIANNQLEVFIEYYTQFGGRETALPNHSNRELFLKLKKAGQPTVYRLDINKSRNDLCPPMLRESQGVQKTSHSFPALMTNADEAGIYLLKLDVSVDRDYSEPNFRWSRWAKIILKSNGNTVLEDIIDYNSCHGGRRSCLANFRRVIWFW